VCERGRIAGLEVTAIYESRCGKHKLSCSRAGAGAGVTTLALAWVR
jgi:hypothetical protein